ncbi:MAG: large subunit ribosomal protein [Patescibacteria group bacterium]|nr:large subunit ribosomal protein [Patescibacteria group bacterium]
MALTKEKKSQILDKVKKAVADSASVVFVNFHGLPVNLADDLRGNLRNSDTSYMVAKKTLAKLALSSSNIEGEMPELPGEIALAYGSDLLSPAKAVFDFGKKNPEMIKIVGGVFEGRFMDANSMIEIAKIPPKEVLYGQFVNVINSPIQGLVIALDQFAKKQTA